MSQAQAATTSLARFVADLSLGDLPGAVINDVTRIITDTVGVAIGGFGVDAGRLVAAAAEEAFGGAGRSTVLGSGRSTSAAEASFTNGYLGNVLDADDVFLNSSHPAVCSVFPALALAEAEDVSGAELIAAVAAGYETAARVGLSLVNSIVTESGAIERSSTIGMGWYSFGAAAAAGRVIGLDAGQIANAFGVTAASSTIGFAQRWQTIAGPKYMMKYSPTGHLASDGVIAALLARRGFTADERILDGEAAYWELAGAKASRIDDVIGDLGSTWWISETSIKPWALGGFGIHAAGLVGSLMTEHDLDPADVERIHVETMERATQPWFTGIEPDGQIDMAFSIPLGVAAVALGIELGPSWQRRHHDDDLLAMARRVVVTEHPAAAKIVAEQLRGGGRMREIPNRVTISANGRTYTADTLFAKGNPTPETRLTDAEVDDKFSLFTRDVIGEERSGRLRVALASLQSIRSIRSELSPLLRGSE